MRGLMALAALTLVSTASSHVSAAASDETAKAGDRVVCKHRKSTGTRFTSKICKTVSQWEAIAEESRASMKELVDRPQIKSCGPSGCN